MVFTVTLNPSLDYIMNISNMVCGQVNRSESEHIYPGGKGINVSLVLKTLGVKSVVLGFIAGFTGRQIKAEVGRFGCAEKFIELPDGISRINVKLKSSEETEINGQGPFIDSKSKEKLFSQLGELAEGDILVLAGNAPKSLGMGIYSEIMDSVAEKKVKVVVDASGEQLIKAVEKRPFLVKPNIHELGEIFGVEIRGCGQAAEYAAKLCDMGAENVIVSMDAGGGLIISDGCKCYCKAKEIKAVNTTGAGDSLVAGFIAKYLERQNAEEALRFGVAVGTAAAGCEYLPALEDIICIYGV